VLREEFREISTPSCLGQNFSLVGILLGFIKGRKGACFVMTGRVSLWVKEHPIITYFVLAYAISWIIVAPLVASAQGFIDVTIPFALHYLNDYAPLSAAIITTAIASGRGGLRELFQRMTKWRVGLGWVLVAAFSPLAVYAIAVGIVVFVLGDPPPDLSLLGTITYIPFLGWGAWVFWILTAGFGEESGWRGYALPKLQGRMSALSATLIVTLLWVGWHLPRFFYYGAYMQLGFSVLPLAAHGFLALAIVLTWLYNSTRGSILMVALFHGGYNFWAASGGAGGSITSTIDALFIIWAVAVVIVAGPANLSRKGKHVL
jgi:membrane protease YdiL (CAAX protease family)